MEKTIDCRGMECPLPVVNAKKTAEAFPEDGTLLVQVDNETAVQNLTKFANSKHFANSNQKLAEKDYLVKIQVTANPDADAIAESAPEAEPTASANSDRFTVVISSNRMGSGDDDLGKALMKAFIFALTSQDKIPENLICYNSGAFLTCEGSDSLEDLKLLEEQGTKIITCGTCLNHYGLTEKLAVGSVSNMYEIVETQIKGGKIIKP
jgi:selenium metabolism protein YedF